jgi:hypothetical protein
MKIWLILARWGDEALRRQVHTLESQLEAERRRLAVATAEIESMAAVIARDRERIKAEGACYARQRAEAEGVTHEQRTSQGIQ